MRHLKAVPFLVVFLALALGAVVLWRALDSAGTPESVMPPAPVVDVDDATPDKGTKPA